MPSIEQLAKLLAASPEDPFVLYALAQEHANAGGRGGAGADGGHEQAIGFYDRCLAADPAYCYAYFHKARSLEALGRIEEARATLEAGMAAAKKAGDGHALSEISGYREEISP